MLKFQPDDAPELPPELPEGQVMARVLPMGHQKIFTGVTDPLGHTPEQKFPTHPKGAVIALPRAVAEAQEAHGRVEIQ